MHDEADGVVFSASRSNRSEKLDASICLERARFADLTRKNPNISSVSAWRKGLLICGLKVRFLSGSPL